MTGGLSNSDTSRRAGNCAGMALPKARGRVLWTKRGLHLAPVNVSSLGVRPTNCGPGNSVRRHNRTAFIRFHQKSQNEGGSNRPYRSHPSVPSILRHSVPVSVLHMKGQKPWNFLGRRRSEEIWKAA